MFQINRAGVITCSSFVIYRTVVIRYGISLFIFVIRYSYTVFRYSYLVVVFAIRYWYALLEVFFSRITHFCAVTNPMQLHHPFVTEKVIRKE